MQIKTGHCLIQLNREKKRIKIKVRQTQIILRLFIITELNFKIIFESLFEERQEVKLKITEIKNGISLAFLSSSFMLT